MMDPITEAVIEEALELIKAGKKAEAQAILIPLAQKSPNIPDAWYLLGFTVPDLDKKLYCFKQVLRIDPSNEAAKKQIARLLEQSQQPEPHPAENVKLVAVPDSGKKKQRKNNVKLMFTLVMTGIVVIAILWGMSAYVLNGINTNKQANDLYINHQCAELMQYTTFEELFPKSVFSSVFGIYQQIEECRMQLALTDAIKLQDWARAYSITENYLAQYPHGALTGEVSEYAGSILLSWSKILLGQNDFASAIKKLEVIQSKFPRTSANSTTTQTMLDDYLLWGEYSFAQKDYIETEKSLQVVLWDPKASVEQVKKASDTLVLNYLEWGNAQVASGQYTEGMASYENAKALNPTLMDYERLKTQASLTQTTALTQTNDFDQALTLIDTLLSKTKSSENRGDALAQRNKILNAYAYSNSLQAQAQITAAANNLCKNVLPVLPIFGLNTATIHFAVDPTFSLSLPNNLMATTPAELHAAVCIAQSYITIETCEYQLGYKAQRNIYVWEVSLNDIKTGTSYQTSNFVGSEPRLCGDTEPFDENKKISGIYGDLPKAQEIIDWLSGIDIAK